MNPKVMLMGQDLYDLELVLAIPELSEEKSFQKNKLVTNSFSITVDNSDNFFSVGYHGSMFQNITWLYQNLKYYDKNNALRWDGEIINISRDNINKTAKIDCRDSLYRFRNQNVEYQSADYETMASAFINICSDYGFTAYNYPTVNQSNVDMTSDAMYFKININESDNLTFQNAIEKFAEYSGTNIYNHNNEIYFKYWKPFAGGVSISITENDLLSLPDISIEENEIINDFSIGYEGDLGVPAIDSANNNLGGLSRTKYEVKSLSEMRSGDDTQIMVKDLTSALKIGENKIKQTNKNYLTNPEPPTRMTISVPFDFQSFINLNTYFYFTLASENWVNKIFEVFAFTLKESDNQIDIVAYEAV